MIRTTLRIFLLHSSLTNISTIERLSGTSRMVPSRFSPCGDRPPFSSAITWTKRLRRKQNTGSWWLRQRPVQKKAKGLRVKWAAYLVYFPYLGLVEMKVSRGYPSLSLPFTTSSLLSFTTLSTRSVSSISRIMVCQLTIRSFSSQW